MDIDIYTGTINTKYAIPCTGDSTIHKLCNK